VASAGRDPSSLGQRSHDIYAHKVVQIPYCLSSISTQFPDDDAFGRQLGTHLAIIIQHLSWLGADYFSSISPGLHFTHLVSQFLSSDTISVRTS
jgi:hypothetical protein